MTVFIVDDDKTIGEMLCRMFRRAGHTAVSTQDSEVAAELVTKGSYDLVITDLEMPGKTGLAVIAELRTRGYRNPIVLMSGNHKALEESVTPLEVNRLVKKPFRGINDFINN